MLTIWYRIASQQDQCPAGESLGIPMIRPKGEDFRLAGFPRTYDHLGDELWPFSASEWEEITLV